MSAIPERPLRVNHAFTRRMRNAAIVFVACALLPAIASLYILVDGTTSILGDQRVWETGKRGRDVSVAEHNKVKFVFVTYDLDVTWRDDRDAAHGGHARWDTIVGTAPPSASRDLRYDPDDPDRFVVRSAIDTIGARWLFVGVVGGGVGIFVIVLLYEAIAMRRRLRTARLCAERSDVVECAVVSEKRVTNNGRPTGWAVYRFRVPGGDATRKQRVHVRDVGPLWANDAKTHLLALRSPDAPDRPLLLAADLYPFAPR